MSVPVRFRGAAAEALRQRFPANAVVGSQQVVDLKDSNAKYMPISTQLVAINTDINNTVEALQKMRDQSAQMQVMREFVAQALPVVDKETNGLTLADALLKIESALRQEVAADNTNAMQMLNSINATLVSARTSFTKSLDTDLVPQVTKPGPLMPAAGGVFGGAVAVLLYALGRRALAGFKSQRV